MIQSLIASVSSEEYVRHDNDATIKQLRIDNDAMNDEIKQLGTLLNKMAINNASQIQQINHQGLEISQLRAENQQLKVSL